MDPCIIKMLVVGIHISVDSGFLCVLNELKGLEVSKEINDRDFFKGLGDCRLGT